APYAINVQWGDSSNELIPRGNGSTFNTKHEYDKPGTYKVTLQGSDSHQLVAFLTVAAIINGKPEVLAKEVSKIPVNKLFVLWPVFAVAATAAVSFWLGEKREKKIVNASKPKAPLFGPPPQAPAAKT